MGKLEGAVVQTQTLGSLWKVRCSVRRRVDLRHRVEAGVFCLWTGRICECQHLPPTFERVSGERKGKKEIE